MTKPIDNNAVRAIDSNAQTQHPKKKVDKKIQSVFDEIERNRQQADKEHEQFMQDMFGDVLENSDSGSKKTDKVDNQKKQTPLKPKKKVDANTQKAFDEIEKKSKKADKEHEQFMKDMFGDVL